MTDEQFLLFSHLTDDGFQTKEPPREGQGSIAISGQVCWFVVVDCCYQELPANRD